MIFIVMEVETYSNHREDLVIMRLTSFQEPLKDTRDQMSIKPTSSEAEKRTLGCIVLLQLL